MQKPSIKQRRKAIKRTRKQFLKFNKRALTMAKMFPHPFSGIMRDRPEGAWVKAMADAEVLLDVEGKAAKAKAREVPVKVTAAKA
jgi:hypothetical protein